MVKSSVLLLIVTSSALAIIASFLLVELVRLNQDLSTSEKELSTLKMGSGEYWCNPDWVTRFVGYNPIASAKEARELYLLLVDKAPRRSYWIIYFPEDNGLPLKLEALEIGVYYEVNGTFRNYAVNFPNARLTIVYCVFKNGTANLESVKTICPASEYQEYQEYQVFP